MKDVFMSTLESALIKANVENIDEILKKYEQRFELGYQAGMNDEEIIGMLEDIEQIVAKARKVEDSSVTHITSKLDLMCFDEFAIRFCNKSGVSFELDEKSTKYVNVNLHGNVADIVAKNSLMISRSTCEGIMYIGHDVFFDQLTINNFSGDVTCCDLEGNDIKILNKSGDIDFENLNANEVSVANISGDINIGNLMCDDFLVENISGDVTMDELRAKNIKLSTVSGDIMINYAIDSKYRMETISGDINILKGNINLSNVSSSSVSGEVSVCGSLQPDLRSTIFKSMRK